MSFGSGHLILAIGLEKLALIFIFAFTLVITTAGRATVLVEEVEDTLLGLVAPARQVLERLLALHHLLATYNATVLVLDEVGLGEATGGVLGVAVENRSLGANSGNFGHLILWNAILFVRPSDPKT